MTRRGSSPAARLWRAPYLLLTAVSLFWAGNSIVGRAAREAIPPVTLAFARWSLALLLVIGFAWPKLRRDWPLLRRHWKATLLLGITGVALFNTLLYVGLHHTSATNALLMQSAQPALILLFGYALLRRRAGVGQMIGVAVAAAGVAAIVARGDPAVLLALRLNRGDALVLVAITLWALYTVLLHWRPPVHPLSFVAATFAVGAGFTAPLSLAELAAGARLGDPAQAAMAVAYVGIFPSVVAYLLFNRAVELVGPAAAGQFLNLMPLLGALLAALLLGEPLGSYHLAGMALILAGIAIFSATATKQQGRPDEAR